MELIKKYIHMNREKGKAVTQITLDDDFNLPDTKPDLIRIILEKGEIRTRRTDDLELLKSIRRGDFQKEDKTFSGEFYKILEDYEKRLDTAT